ncbi:MAG: CDP-diacylglycerol--glycerol-3-phosphate 3-phosphatidyltransferase [Clostridiaceae bacterium]|nr:CDP-diacylglycerol--glycerol-3-phosphate 3-phosphatidyltransferase [Clostridiaceae bacterium]
MTIPNALTIFRIALIPLFWVLETSASPAARWAALFVFVLASVTDFADGKIARKTGKITSFGKIMDPLADKLLVISALMIFLEAGRASAVAVMLIIARELAVTSLRVVAISEGKLMAAAKSGKWKTASQFFYIILMLLHIETMSFIPAPLLIEQIAQWIVAAITIWSGIDYFYRNRELIRATVA